MCLPTDILRELTSYLFALFFSCFGQNLAANLLTEEAIVNTN